MTTWTSISNAAVAVGGIPSSSTVTALRDNPSAVAEASTGAPVVFAGWHPYDKVSVGDGKTGLFYDHAVTGTVSSIVTPDFEDGYEYRLVGLDLSHTNTLSNSSLKLESFKETDAVYAEVRDTASASAFVSFGFHAEFYLPRVASIAHFVGTLSHGGSSYSSNVDLDSAMYLVPAQKLLRARLRFSTGNVDGGKAYLFRRREYASLP
jgi:hypothetical protein